jgi:hypothetical protein
MQAVLRQHPGPRPLRLAIARKPRILEQGSKDMEKPNVNQKIMKVLCFGKRKTADIF